MSKSNILYLFFFFAGTVSAQQYSIYQSITTANGLPSNYVFAVCEDENGFFWAGTDKGLCRYNGFTWQVWDKDNGLPGNYITHLYANRRGGLWFEIANKGFFYFDIATARSRKIELSDVSIDNDGNVFYTKPSKTNGCTDVFLIAAGKNFSDEKVYEYRPNPNVKVLADANSKKVICLTASGLDLHKNELEYKGQWSLEYRMLPKKDTWGSVVLANDTIVITTSYFYKYATNGKLLSSRTLFKSNNAYANNRITKNGCYVTDIKTGYYFIDNNSRTTFYNCKSGLGSNYVNQVYEMKDGTIVFATLGAGLQLKKNDYKKSFLSGNRSVRSIVKSGDKWYILAGDKVLAINQSTLSLENVGTVENSALHLFCAGNQILIGSLKGIEFYEIKKKLHPFHFIPLNAGISSIFQTKTGFIASTYGAGLVSFTSSSASVSPLPSAPIVEKTTPLSNGYAMLSYEDGLVLTDTIRHRIVRLTQKDGLLSNSIQSIYENADTIWIGTKAGLNVYAKGRVVQTVSYTEGFQGNKVIYSFQDKKHQLWVVSDKYLHLYNNGKLKATTSHPLTADNDDLVNTALYDPATGVLATGTLRNISLVSVANIKTNNELITPKIMGVVVDGKAVETPGTIKIPYRFKNISFYVAPFATSPSSKCAMYYKLDGREEGWNQLKDSLSFSYTALRPGTYRFKGKIVNADGYESSETLLGLLVVAKPFWQRAWFILLLFFITILITTLVVKQAEVIKRRKKDAKLLMQQTLQRERERISKDLHDHLGSNLVTIVAQVDNIETKLHRKSFTEAANTVKHLSVQTREVMNVLRETIWAVQENEHSIESFAIRIRTFLQRLYESTGISWQLKVLPGDEVQLSPKQTLHLFRVMQEASQNIIKHSKASEVNYIFKVKLQCFQITITDNGIGLGESRIMSVFSNGISNMEQRVQELGGTISFDTENGTVIKIEIPSGRLV